jgi:hypothetical protein
MSRLEIIKTYKIYIGGQFPRTESGRYYPLKNKSGKVLANICLSSRKDFRNAVVAARAAVGSWSSKSGLNRSQILYRIAEMLEGRRAQFIQELQLQGSSIKAAEEEVNISIDRLVYYAGWCDKYQQLFSSVNPVASSHFNFSVPEPSGVVALLAPQENSLIGLVSAIAPVIAGGNTCIALASENFPLCAVTFAEVINSSDVPGGVVNILMSKVALITGVTGQDGAYLSELLLSKGYTVHGVKRRSSLFNTDRIDHLYQDQHEKQVNFKLHHGDLTDSTNLIRIVQEVQPDEIYNLAAMSHVK